jgi:O-succinylbenzoate synthase
VSHRLNYRRYRLAFRAPLRTAHGPWSEREGLIVRLESEGGVAGWGEAAPIPDFGTETVAEAEAACAALGSPVDELRIASAVPASLGCLRRALSCALRDLAGARGTGSDAVSVAALLPAGKTAIAAATAMAVSGFRVFMWKVGAGDIADELALLNDVCAALPAGAKLRLDANGAWDRRGAERWLGKCADYPVEFIEQPVARDRAGAADLLLGLASDYPTPIALDESVAGEGDIRRWIGAGWKGVFVVKPSLLGDAEAALALLSQADSDVVFSSALETGIGARDALRAAFSWKGKKRAIGFGVWPLFADGRFDGPWAAPFLRRQDAERVNPEVLWNALS